MYTACVQHTVPKQPADVPLGDKVQLGKAKALVKMAGGSATNHSLLSVLG